MDYIKIFNKTFISDLNKQEKDGIEKLLHYKNEDRPFEFAQTQVRDFYFRKLIDLEKISDFNLRKYAALFAKRNNLYSKNASKKMIQNELLKAFNKEYSGKNYGIFLKDLASRYALKTAYLHHEHNKTLTAYLYYYDEIQKFTLRKLKENIETRNMFMEYNNRSGFRVENAYPLPINTEIEPKLELLVKNELENKTPEKKIIIKSKPKEELFPDFEEEEKLILIHFLFSDKAALSTVESARILFHIGGIEEGKMLLYEDPKLNKYYNRISKGPSYYGDKKALQLLESIRLKIKYFELPKLKTAINLSLTNYKNSKLKKDLEK